MTPYRDPELWEEAKSAARKRLGGHSARAMQLAGELYRRAGGRYQGRKTAAQRSLTRWTGQDWTTRSGRPSRETGERYLPRKVIEKLTPAEYAATTRAKRRGTREGEQYVPQPPKIRAKVARLKREENPMARTPTPAQIAARERFAEMARSGAFKRKAKSNPRPKVTVGDKISQLMDEGYPQKQAVAIALSEERAGKVKRNPSAKDSRTEVHLGGRYYGIIGKNSGLGHYTQIVYRDPKDIEGDKVVPDFNGQYYQSMNAASRALERYKKKLLLENPRAPRRPSLYVGPDPGNRFAQCYSTLDDIDFESPYFRERRVTPARALKANAMLDKVLDMMEKIAKIING